MTTVHSVAWGSGSMWHSVARHSVVWHWDAAPWVGRKKRRGEKENYQIRTGSENTQYKEFQKDTSGQVQTVLYFIVCTEVKNRVVDLTVANYNNNSGQLDSTVYCQYTL